MAKKKKKKSFAVELRYVTRPTDEQFNKIKEFVLNKYSDEELDRKSVV